MVPPKYQELTAEQIISKKQNGVLVKGKYFFQFSSSAGMICLNFFVVIAGESMGVKSEVRTLTPTSYLDFTVDPGAEFSQPICPDWTSFAYTLDEPLLFGKMHRFCYYCIL